MNTNLTALVSTFHSLRPKYDELVLATIIETLGSTYRKAGARMLITPDSEFFGLLGGGCFEADLIAHASEVFDNKQPKIVFYDMRAPEDEIWGLGLGCNGAVRILLQPVSTQDRENTVRLIEQALLKKEKQVLLTICESHNIDLQKGQNYLLQFARDTPVNLPVNSPDDIIAATSHVYQSETCSLIHYEKDDHSLTVFCSVIKPPFHLLIIGAGPDATPVIRFAKELGWEITLVDYRDSFIKQKSFAAVDHTILTPPETLAEQVDLHAIDAIVLMTHKIEYDERYLKQLTRTSAKYIGLLGPAARRDRLMTSLGEDEKLIREQTFGPVGLDIGGELPEEIALSLVAEIQATLYKRDGGPLHKKNTPLHEEQVCSNDDLHAVILAAGGAKRFGGLKQLLEYKGTSLLRRSINIASEILDKRVWVVLGARAQKIRRNIDELNARIIVNEDWDNGIASSLKTGVEAMPDNCAGILYLLCDQALITGQHLQQLYELWLTDKSKIVASAYADTVGVPVIIPRHYFPAILELEGDVGAKSVIRKYADNVVSVNIPDAEFDIDTETDYIALLSR